MKEKQKSTNQLKNKSVSEDLLSSYRKALMKLKDFFDSLDNFDMDEDIDKTMKVMDSILKCGEKLGKGIETLGILEKRVQAEEQSSTKIRGGAKLSLLESDEL